MEVLVLALFYGPIYFFVFSLTGGLGGAIARGREDRSLLANAWLGVFGWMAASVIWRQASGAWPVEVDLRLAAWALGCSVVLAFFLGKRDDGRLVHEAGQV